MAELMVGLRQQAGIAAKALEFAILTACRSGEVRLAAWDEIDLDSRVWVIPGERMKAGKEHRVPLSDAAMAEQIRQTWGSSKHTTMMEDGRDIAEGYKAAFGAGSSRDQMEN